MGGFILLQRPFLNIWLAYFFYSLIFTYWSFSLSFSIIVEGISLLILLVLSSSYSIIVAGISLLLLSIIVAGISFSFSKIVAGISLSLSKIVAGISLSITVAGIS